MCKQSSGFSRAYFHSSSAVLAETQVAPLPLWPLSARILCYLVNSLALT